MTPGTDLVTGAFGFSAGLLVRELLAAGRQVVAADLPAVLQDAGRRQLLTRLGIDLDHPRLEIVPADLLAPPTLAALFERPFERVFHTASLYDYSAPLERLRRINVEGTRNLLACATRAELQRFVHWSTCGVFGKPYPIADGARRNTPFTEESSSPKTTPAESRGPAGSYLVNAYSVSKWEQEKLVWQAQREAGLPVTVVRPAPIYGPGSQYGHGGIIQLVARGLMRVIPRDAQNFITASVHVEDVAHFACFIAERPEAVGEDYIVADSSVISYHEFLHYIALLVGRRMWDIPLVPMPAMRVLVTALAKVSWYLEQRYGLRRLRVLEVQSAVYVGSSYWISNRKSLATGFTYRYADVREGLKNTVAWMAGAGWL